MASPAPDSQQSDGGTDATSEIGFCGDFATLTPDNVAAAAAFDGVVALLEQNDHQDSTESYHKRFVSIDLPPSSPQPSSTNSSFSELNSPPSPAQPGSAPLLPSSSQPTRATGHYRLSLDVLPGGPDGSWRIGKGGARTDVDLLIIPPGQHRGSGVANVHALISIHRQSGAFMLRSTSKHAVIYLSAGVDGRDLVLRSGEQTVLWKTFNRLRIGALDYQLTIAVEHEGHFKMMRDEFLTSVMNESSLPHPKLDVLPQLHHQKELGGYITHTVISAGAFGMVRSAVDSATGNPVAVKRVVCRKREDARAVAEEVRIARMFASDDADGRIIPVLSTWCEHGAVPPCNETPEDISLAMPLGLTDFAHANLDHHSMETRLALFRCTLVGLARIHAAGVMHRDISRKNLLVRSFKPPLAAICDFGKATDRQSSYNTAIGPVDTVAPEVWTSEPRRPYRKAVDIWSLGYAWLSTFGDLTRRHSAAGNLKTDSTRAIRIQNLLDAWARDGTVPRDLADLLRSMLSYQPEKRCTAEEALRYPVWLPDDLAPPAEEPAGPEEARRKRPRLLTPGLDEDGPVSKGYTTMPDTASGT